MIVQKRLQPITAVLTVPGEAKTARLVPAQDLIQLTRRAKEVIQIPGI